MMMYAKTLKDKHPVVSPPLPDASDGIAEQ